MTVVSVLVLALSAIGIYFVVDIYDNNQATNDNFLPNASSSSTMKENQPISSSTVPSSSEVPIEELLTLSSAEEQVIQLFQERAQNDPEWAFLK